MIIIDKLPDYKHIKNIIFDIDGTITQWQDIPKFLQKALAVLNISCTSDDLNGLYKAMHLRELHALTTGEALEDAYASLLSLYIPSLKRNHHTGTELKDIMFQMEADETFISPNVVDVISYLNTYYQLFCYTNWFYNQALKKLNKYDLTKYFKTIYSSEDTFIKSSSLGFETILVREKIKSKETVCVGDSKTDILPSKWAGLTSIYLDYGITTPEDLTKKMEIMHAADATITEFSDLKRILKK